MLTLALSVAAGACGGSSSTAPASQGPQQASVHAVALEAAMRSLSLAVEAYQADNGAYPTAVTQATVGSYLSPWPLNPWTRQPIAEGTAVGDFTYTLTAGGFQLAGHKADGTDVVMP
jgi:type II secretory pathway pseudopilin PulG